MCHMLKKQTEKEHIYFFNEQNAFISDTIPDCVNSPL